MLVAILATLVAVTLWLAVREFLADRRARHAQRRLEEVLEKELEFHRYRGEQLARMLDEAAARALNLSPLAVRDAELAVRPSAGESLPTGSLEDAIDRLPEVLAKEVRAIDGDDVQREYLDTIARELQGGADPDALAERLFQG